MVDSLAWSQPALFDSHIPVRLRFDVLVDPQEETAVIAFEAVQFPEKRLIALESTGPVAFSAVEERVRGMATRFTALIREHTGPFPP